MKRLLLVDDDPKTLTRMMDDGPTFGWDVVPRPRLGNERTVLTSDEVLDAAIIDVEKVSTAEIDQFRSDWIATHAGKPLVVLTGECSSDRALHLHRLGLNVILRKDSGRDASIRINSILKTGRDFLMAGASEAMIKIRKEITRLAKVGFKVLITGETGVGKNLVAQDIHDLSPRSNKPFIYVNCGGLPETLLQSALFGHVKGAFTGAVKDTIGKFEQADGGTIFLDEIGNAPLNVQRGILDVVNESIIVPVGSAVPKKVDVRIIAATNRNLQKDISERLFQEDLFYRIRDDEIYVPPLRERIKDLDELVPRFVAEVLQENPALDGSRFELVPAAMDLLRSSQWHGNIRALKGVIRKSCSESDGDILRFQLSAAERSGESRSGVAAESLPSLSQWNPKHVIDQSVAIKYFVRAIIEAQGVATEAVKSLQLDLSQAKTTSHSNSAMDEILRCLCQVNGNAEDLADSWGVPFSSLFNTITHANRMDKYADALLSKFGGLDGVARRFETTPERLDRTISRIRDFQKAKS